MLDVLQNFGIENTAWLLCVSKDTSAENEIKALLAALDAAITAVTTIAGDELTHVVTCEMCGSPEIQEEMWIDSNTNEIINSSGDDLWCPECEDHQGVATIGCLRSERPALLEKLYNGMHDFACGHKALRDESHPDTCRVCAAENKCHPTCRGYAAFDAERAPDTARVYDHDTALEIERCDACNIFVDDAAAYAQWVADGKPVL